MPLKLSLKPGEKFAINGAVIVNGDRRGTLVVQNHASILRERDILQPWILSRRRPGGFIFRS